MPFARDFTRSPYSDDEKRIVNWLNKITKGNSVGGGDDPIGFFMASYEMVIAERKEMKLQINALKLDNDRLYAIATEYKDAATRPVHEDESGGC